MNTMYMYKVNVHCIKFELLREIKEIRGSFVKISIQDFASSHCFPRACIITVSLIKIHICATYMTCDLLF